MVLEEIFKDFQYATYNRINGIGLFDATEDLVTFYYSEEESIFTDGEIIENTNGKMIVKNPTYCISVWYYDKKKYSDPRTICFEVFLSNMDQETFNKAKKKAKLLSTKVHFRIKNYLASREK